MLTDHSALRVSRAVSFRATLLAESVRRRSSPANLPRSAERHPKFFSYPVTYRSRHAFGAGMLSADVAMLSVLRSIAVYPTARALCMERTDKAAISSCECFAPSRIIFLIVCVTSISFRPDIKFSHLVHVEIALP